MTINPESNTTPAATFAPAIPENAQDFVEDEIFLCQRVDFKNQSKIVYELLADDCKTVGHLLSAKDIIDANYESDLKGTPNNNGYIFPMYPEVMLTLGFLARNKTVLEIGGSIGDNATLLGLFGAKRVYLNDNDLDALKVFELNNRRYPQNVQDKLKTLEGSFFEILERTPELAEEVDVVLCRNVFHFFDEREQNRFCEDLKKILKPGGIAVISANANPNIPNTIDICYKQIICHVYDHTKQAAPIITLYQIYTPSSEEEFKQSSSEFFDLYKRENGRRWTVNNEKFNTLPDNVRKKISSNFEKFKDQIAPIKDGTVRVIRSCIRLYTVQALSNIFAMQGFKVLKPFYADGEGHLCERKDASHVGIFIKRLN